MMLSASWILLQIIHLKADRDNNLKLCWYINHSMPQGSLREQNFKPKIPNFLYVLFIFSLLCGFLVVNQTGHILAFDPHTKRIKKALLQPEVFSLLCLFFDLGFFHNLDSTFLAPKCSIKHFRHFHAKPSKLYKKNYQDTQQQHRIQQWLIYIYEEVLAFTQHKPDFGLLKQETHFSHTDFKLMRTCTLKEGWASLCQWKNCFVPAMSVWDETHGRKTSNLTINRIFSWIKINM